MKISRFKWLFNVHETVLERFRCIYQIALMFPINKDNEMKLIPTNNKLNLIPHKTSCQLI